MGFLGTIFKKIVFGAVSVAISLGLLSSFAADTNISPKALFLREFVIRPICTSIKRDGGITGFYGIDMSKISLYKPSKGYTLEKTEVDGLPVEILKKEGSENSDRVIYQLHGGAFVYGYNDIYRNQAERWSALAGGATVVSIDYRLAPKDVFPAALEDALKGWDWMLSNGYKEENIVVVGDSAGGNLALSLGLSLRDSGRTMPKAMVLMSPWADLSEEGKSYKTNLYKDPMFGIKEGTERKDGYHAVSVVYAGDMDVHNPLISPVYGDYKDFCPMLIQSGTYEVLESNSDMIYENALANGVDVTLTKYEGMWHMFQLFGDLFPESTAAWKQVGEQFTEWYDA